MLTTLKKLSSLMLVAALLIVVSCQEEGEPNTPVASTIDFSSTTANDKVTFENLSTNAATYAWDFGDGGTSTAPSPEHVYESSGTYDVTLTTLDFEKKTSTKTKGVTVMIAPTPNFAVEVDEFSAMLTNTSDEGASYSWDFGDGSEDVTTANATHEYAETGTYVVTLTVVGVDGSTVTKTQEVEIEGAPGLSEEILTGGSARTWKIRPAASSFGVGPGKNDMSWWPANGNISGDRPCLFNDEFIFKVDNEFEYDSKGDLWGEAYMGVADGCLDEADLPAATAAWGSGVHEWSFEAAEGATPATITVTGTGAFLALPKAYNGAEYPATPVTPPLADASVTYEVLSYEAETEALTIAVNIPGGFWTFVLIPAE
jgi:PKD repeat protein